MKTLYKNRLRKFAKKLGQIIDHPEHGVMKMIEVVIIEKSMRLRIPIEIITQNWIWQELPEVFPKSWNYSERTGDPVLTIRGENFETTECVFEFFGVEDYEMFAHLFCVQDGKQQQIEKWGGRKLDENSTGPDFAYNIYELIKIK